MSTLISHGELPEWIAGTMLQSSDASGWKGLTARSYRYMPQEVAVPGMRDFLVIAYLGGTPRMARRLDGGWSEAACHTGDFSLLNRGQHSQWRWKGAIEVAHIYLGASMMARVAEDLLDKAIEEVELHDVLAGRDPAITSIVQAIHLENVAKVSRSQLYVDALSTTLAVQLLRNYSSVTVRDLSDTDRLSQAQRSLVIERINDRLDDAPDLADLAGTLGLGLWTFGRRFRATFGTTPHRYVTERRVTVASDLVRRTSQPLKEIAAKCGFYDQAHMTRVFRHALATTPAEIRRASRA